MWTRLLALTVGCSSLLALPACAPDFSPDLYNIAPVRDAGVAPRPSRPSPTPANPDEPEDDGDAGLDESSSDAASGDVPGELPGDDDVLAEPKDGCDLTGRWLMTERLLSSALGAKQAIYNWYYLEIEQEGTALRFTKSQVCGSKVNGLQPVIVSMDDSKAWPSYLKHPSYEGRRGTSVASASGCNVEVEKAAIIRGASFETYRDLTIKLPTLEEPATPADPGWEDWDEDGKPGVSMRVSGSITGMLYAATRTWTSYKGAVPAADSSVTLPMLWGQERTTLGYEGSPLLAADAARDTDATQHVAQLTRLTAEQAQGDDAARCVTVRDLATTLTPNAMK